VKRSATGRRPLLLALLATIALGAVGCYQEPVAITTFPPGELDTPTPELTPVPPSPPRPTPLPVPTPTAAITPQTATDVPSPAPTPTPEVSPTPSQVAVVATPYAGCTNGWFNPLPGSPEFDEGVEILGNYMGQLGEWNIVDMRYFTGPDSPGVIEPRFDPVHRWYIRAALVDDPGYKGRWLIEKRTDLILGVSAVAPWDSFGYESPDWTGFIGEGPPTTYTGLPGQWSGIPYDFVTGEGDGGQPGLPAEVVECLAAT
jgi:hypothetical protein